MTRYLLVSAGLLLAASAVSTAQECDCGPRTLDDLKRLSRAQLIELFKRSEMGRPLDGTAKGQMVDLTDKLPRLKMRIANSLWNGKTARASDGYFINRWTFRSDWISSHYSIGPSWIDGKPAVIMEYPPKTPLFWNMHDELREVAPGLYLGPVFERFPCPKFRGFIGLQIECGCK